MAVATVVALMPSSAGAAQTLAVGFTRTATGWDAAASLGGVTQTRALTFDGQGALTPQAQPFTVGGIELALGTVTGYAGITSVEAASQNALHLKRLTDSLAELARLDDAELRIECEPTALGELADDIAHRYHSQAHQRDIALG